MEHACASARPTKTLTRTAYIPINGASSIRSLNRYCEMTAENGVGTESCHQDLDFRSVEPVPSGKLRKSFGVAFNGVPQIRRHFASRG